MVFKWFEIVYSIPKVLPLKVQVLVLILKEEGNVATIYLQLSCKLFLGCKKKRNGVLSL